MSYLYSAKKNSFYYLLFKDAYEKSGSWPDDLVSVEDGVYVEFSGDVPEGKIRGSTALGAPRWVDLDKVVDSK